MLLKQNVLDFTHVALLFSLASGPKQALHFCPDGEGQITTIIVTAAQELQNMGLVSITGESLVTLQFSLTHQGEQMVGELSSGRKPDAVPTDPAQNSSPEPSVTSANPAAGKIA